MKRFILIVAFLCLLPVAAQEAPWDSGRWVIQNNCTGITQKGLGCYNTSTLAFCIGNGSTCAAVGGGTGDMLKADNLSGLASNATARTNIGVAVGSDVQAHSNNLDTYAGITPSANMQTFLGYSLFSDMVAGLSLTIGTDTQAHSTLLDSIAATTPVNQGILSYLTGGGYDWRTTHTHDNSAHQIVDATDATKTILLDPSGSAAGVKTTIKSNMTATGTVNIPSNWTDGDSLAGLANPQTLTNKILTAPKIQNQETIVATDYQIATNDMYQGQFSNFGMGAGTNIATLPVAGAGMNGLFVIATNVATWVVNSMNTNKIYVNGVLATNGIKAAGPSVGDAFAFFSFKTGSSTWNWIFKSVQGTQVAY